MIRGPHSFDVLPSDVDNPYMATVHSEGGDDFTDGVIVIKPPIPISESRLDSFNEKSDGEVIVGISNEVSSEHLDGTIICYSQQECGNLAPHQDALSAPVRSVARDLLDMLIEPADKFIHAQ